MLSKSAFAVALSLTIVSCKSSFLGFGPSKAEAARHAGDGLAAHAFRFDDVVRDTKTSQARAKIARHALTPSRLYGDSSVWNAINDRDSSRSLMIDGVFDNVRGGYTFRANAGRSAAASLGEARHLMRLQLEPDGAYTWDTSVEQAIGALPVAFVGRAMNMLFASAESPSARDLRAESAQAFPRTARALGRLFSLDSARSLPLGDGSSSTTIAVRWHSERLRPAMPRFAGYIAKYIEPATYSITLSDKRGQTYWQASGDKGALLVRWRSNSGRLLPLEGGSSAMPDTLRIRMDFNTKYKMFRVGFAELVGDFIVQRGPHSVGWFMRFREEPKWQLPLFTETLIRSPLRRPFEGRGSELYLAVHGGSGPQTVLVRRTHTEVKESRVIRWMGSLGATAMSDFQGATENEQNRFLYAAFTALKTDAEAALTGDE
ncbi:MAG: hypothetical protein ACT4P6_17765 [Gemmatimonadaceae bacterium]